EAVNAIKRRALVEASGNVTLDRIRAIAETGVDFISCGAITHSAPILDISMKIGVEQ
ncbi:MAG: nicotinate-nucleotide diphosphorylase (carboxylating), partial [Bacteroidia bacterium]|nr:nicotinate-nucleotide diphosphorylase (carboxylating) [Bacteroidia bacterium]